MTPHGIHKLGQYGTPNERLALSVIAIILLVAILGLVGNMGLKDELDAQERYCDGVATNLHPDYNGNAEEICPKPQG